MLVFSEPCSAVAAGKQSTSISFSPADGDDRARINTTYLKVSWTGPVDHVETSSSHILIPGYIQEPWFHTDTERTVILEENQLRSGFYRNLTGLFILVIVSKETHRIRLVANPVGGYRYYMRWNNHRLLLGDSLKAVSGSPASLNPVAVQEVLEYRQISGEDSLVDSIRQLPSGHYWDVDLSGIRNKVNYYDENYSMHTNHRTIEQHASEVERILNDSLGRAIKPGSRVAILLSGGVDSTILAAIAREKTSNLVAISHESVEHHNSELETAEQFATELGIPHRVVTIEDASIPDAFIDTVRIMEQPPRNKSALILYLMFREMSGEFDQIIYGEAADTLFGSNHVRQYYQRYLKRQKLNALTQRIPFCRKFIDFLPENNRFRRLQSETIDQFMRAINRISLQPSSQEMIASWLPEKRSLYVQSSLSCRNYDPYPDRLTGELKTLKDYLLRMNCTDHFHEAGSLARHFGMELINTFIDEQVIRYAESMDTESYFGQEYIKPVLRKIGEHYFTPELMYLPKKGFPTPFRDWMSSVLVAIWQDARKRFDVIDCEDLEFQWTLSALHILLEHLEISFAADDIAGATPGTL